MRQYDQLKFGACAYMTLSDALSCPSPPKACDRTPRPQTEADRDGPMALEVVLTASLGAIFFLS